VQDDQEFDITQSEILGHLFTNTATIRVIQAAANPSIRDSVPPTSALRFDPNVTRKREREGSVRPNGTSSSNAWKPNKRGYRNWIQTNLYHPEKMNLSGGMAVHQKSRSSPIHRMRDRVLGNSTLHVK
jgi:hypothetical protein